MDTIPSTIAVTNWQEVAKDMHQRGFSLVPNVLSHSHCETLKERYTNPDGYRKTVVMERHRYGLGEYKYFDYPLPSIVQQLREHLYPHLAPIANRWAEVLGLDTVFPATHEGLLAKCHANDQHEATALILKYGQGGFNTLHQDLYGAVYFPLQAALFLSEPDRDYTGGEFVLTEQVPRAQTKATVLQPGKGDMLIFTTNFRPMEGNKGYYRVNMKHGVSEVRMGERYTLGIIFHDAST